jgi:hypothetical protein
MDVIWGVNFKRFIRRKRHQLTYGSGQDRRFTYNFFERFGGYYAGTLNEFRVQANYRATEKFSISASETWDRFRLPLPNGNFSVVLGSLQGNYSFNPFLTFTSLIRWTRRIPRLSAPISVLGTTIAPTAIFTSFTTLGRSSPA